MTNRVTQTAYSYVGSQRKESSHEATWFDVAKAYDAGLHFGLNARQAANRALKNMVNLPEPRRSGKSPATTTRIPRGLPSGWYEKHLQRMGQPQFHCSNSTGICDHCGTPTQFHDTGNYYCPTSKIKGE